MEQKTERRRAGQVAGQSAEKVVDVLTPHGIRDDHAGKKRDYAGAEHRVDTNDVAGVLQILQLGVGDFAVHLGEGFEAAHRQQRMPERDNNGDGADLRPEGSTEPAERVLAELEIARQRGRRNLDVAADQDGDGAPNQESHDHDGGDLHNAKRLAAGLVDALDVVPPEIEGNGDAEDRGKQIGADGVADVGHPGDFIEQVSEILAGANHADGAGKNVIEDEGGDREPRHEMIHSVAHDDIHAAAHKHAKGY